VAFIALTQTPLVANFIFIGLLITGTGGVILLGNNTFVRNGNQWMKKHIQGQ
jgi:hypothetical protein